jgi:hypothetical protein
MDVNGRHVIEVLSGHFTGGTDQRESECCTSTHPEHNTRMQQTTVQKGNKEHTRT